MTHPGPWQSVIEQLLAGNDRHAGGTMLHPHMTEERRVELLAGQKPVALVLACADSRASPEVVFDQGLGDLFVLRVAGNVADEIVLASAEYAVAHLAVPLLLVLGHSRCGAITATLHGEATAGHLPLLAAMLAPAIAQARREPGAVESAALVDAAARAHARLTAERLRVESAIVDDAVRAGRTAIRAAFHHLETGRVELL